MSSYTDKLQEALRNCCVENETAVTLAAVFGVQLNMRSLVMAITIERQGQRIYLTGDTYPVKDRIKALGGHWDDERRAWWIGATKDKEAQALADSLNGAGAAPDAPRAKQSPDDIRLTGKGEYKSRTYYLGSRTRDGARIRCLTLPHENGDYLDFWANAGAVTVTKTYQPREYRGRQEYTTLGSIARFVAKKKRGESQGRDMSYFGNGCAECRALGALCQRCAFDEYDN
jgi:hypothetical protein